LFFKSKRGLEVRLLLNTRQEIQVMTPSGNRNAGGGRCQGPAALTKVLTFAKEWSKKDIHVHQSMELRILQWMNFRWWQESGLSEHYCCDYLDTWRYSNKNEAYHPICFSRLNSTDRVLSMLLLFE
jgi:hypothetical protein